MQKIDIKLKFAALIPEFISQFLSTEYIDKDSFNCMALEDVREAVSGAADPGFDEMKRFLSTETSSMYEKLKDSGELSKEEKISGMMEILDSEINEVDEKYYHVYTAQELKHIFNLMIYNIDILHKRYTDETGLNMELVIGFKLNPDIGGEEANMVVEFLPEGEESSAPVEADFFVPIEDSRVSGGITARVFFIVEKKNEEKFREIFRNITDIIDLKNIENNESRKNLN
ncbi:MAG: hypothetical protein ACLFP1_02695 [Candidatus Goldiibacteriota bacterium]